MKQNNIRKTEKADSCAERRLSQPCLFAYSSSANESLWTGYRKLFSGSSVVQILSLIPLSDDLRDNLVQVAYDTVELSVFREI